MIRAPRHDTSATVTTSYAHVAAVAEDCGDEPLVAGPWLYAVRKVPVLGQPVIYRTRCEVRHG